MSKPELFMNNRDDCGKQTVGMCVYSVGWIMSGSAHDGTYMETKSSSSSSTDIQLIEVIGQIVNIKLIIVQAPS